MNRDHSMLFSPARIGSLVVPNRFVRSGTAEIAAALLGEFTEEDIASYRRLARSGIGLLIVGGPAVLPLAACESSIDAWDYCYDSGSIAGTQRLLGAIREEAPDCKILAQLECNALIAGDRPAAPSPVQSPFYHERFRELSSSEIEALIAAFVETIVRMDVEGFDGVQLHAAHGGALWYFLSPRGNWRDDKYGGSVENRVRIVAEIVQGVRQRIGAFPILIKANCIDHLEGGIDKELFAVTARELERVGIDAIEVSGGTWDSLTRSEAELGFRPIPAAESRTGILAPENQAYYRSFIEGLSLSIPLILVGGIRNVDVAEAVVEDGVADFVAMCRPLIREPDLVDRWKRGEGSAEAECIACNACIHSMYLPFDRLGRRTVTCLAQHDRELFNEALRWLDSAIDEIVVDPSVRGAESRKDE